MLVNIARTKESSAADRIEGFPFFHEGDFWRFNYLDNAREKGQHAIELAKRGCAKSHSLAAIGGRNLILVENKIAKRRVNTVITAYLSEYLKVDGDGTLNKFVPAINFVFANTPWPHLLLKNSSNVMAWRMGYKDEYGIEKGTLNQVMAVSAKDDADKLRGKRGWILFEEMGTFRNLLSLYNTTRRSVEEGNLAFACMYLVGTANDNESDFSSARTLLYNTKGFNINTVPNVYDRPKEGRPTFGYFYPAYINRKKCCNEDGVSDIVAALVEIYKARAAARTTGDPSTVLRVIAEDPITPAEAIIKVKNAYFPVPQLQERLTILDSDPKAFDDVYIGNLVLDNKGEVIFKATNDSPIRQWKTDNSVKGAIEIFEMPEKDSSGKVFANRYILGNDPVDNDQAESSSFSSTFVLDLFTDRIVAEYTGRQLFADDNYEIARLLCMFYNGTLLFESNRKGIYAYFKKMNSTHLLAETPEFLREKQMIKYSAFGSNAYGVNANATINNYANQLIKDWLLKPVETTTENGDIITSANLYHIRNRALLEELIGFNPEVNVDRIRALGMAMLLREQRIITYGGNLNTAYEEAVGKDYLGKDPFFTRNYRPAEHSFFPKN